MKPNITKGTIYSIAVLIISAVIGKTIIDILPRSFSSHSLSIIIASLAVFLILNTHVRKQIRDKKSASIMRIHELLLPALVVILLVIEYSINTSIILNTLAILNQAKTLIGLFIIILGISVIWFTKLYVEKNGTENHSKRSRSSNKKARK